MANNVIEVCAVTKRFGEVEAAAGIDLTIHEGEIFGLIGHNGAGKSTLFKMMLGLLPVTSGVIRIHKHELRGQAFRNVRRTIGYLPENIVFYDNLTGLETLEFYAELKGVDKSECGFLLEKVGLKKAARRRVRGYSKGMKQRLGFAQSMLGSPTILFLDEPTNGLDPEGIREFYQIVKEMRDNGTTVILTSHILAEIQERVDRLAIMKLGKVQALGTVQELRETMNLPISVQITMQPETHEELLSALAIHGLKEYEVLGDRITIRCPRDMKMLVVTILTELKDNIQDLNMREPSLEDLFLGYAV